MRLLTSLIVVATLLWGGYWFVGAKTTETALQNWFEARQADGWLAEYSDIKTRGFPNRFDTTITDLELADTRAGLAWTMPFFQILTLSYTPNHIVVAFPHEQTIATPTEKFRLTSDTMRGSVVFKPKTSLELDRTSFELSNLAIASNQGTSTRITSGQFATRQGVQPMSHDIYFDATEMRLSQPMLRMLDPAGRLNDTFEQVRLDMTVQFDKPWDRFAIEAARPQPANIDLKTFHAQWGELTFQAAGTLEVGPSGLPTGTIDIRAKNWRDMLRVATDSGLISASAAPTIENMLAVAAGMKGNPETLDAPLSFRNGTLYFAGLPLAPAPRLALR